MESDPYSPAEGFFNAVSPGEAGGLAAQIVLTAALVLVSATLSASESAFFSLAPSDLDAMAKSHKGNARKATRLMRDPQRLLGTILIGNNLVNIAIVLLSAHVLEAVCNFAAYPVLAFAVQIVGVTFLLLLFGEIIPKVYATAHATRFALFVAPFMTVAHALFAPLSALLAKGGALVDARIRGRERMSLDDLSDAIDLTTGVTDDEEEILKGIVEFNTIEASEIMCPRVDMVTVELGTGFRELVRLIVDSGYSRIPVYHETLDDIRGLLYVKDLLPHLDRGDEFHWQDLLREAYFVPENKMVNDLLDELQEKRIHMAIVVDEYGGTSGIVTLEDLIEEIVGDISDEFDGDEQLYAKVNDTTFLFEGKTSINDFCRVVEYEGEAFDQVNADTLAGLLLEHMGDMPKASDRIEIAGFAFKVESADSRRIKKIEVKLPAPPPEEALGR